MEKSEKPDPRRTIGGIIAALDKRIGALEQNAPSAKPGVPAGDAASGATAPGPADAAQGARARPAADRLEALGAELGDKLRDIETSLVNRIADVDDDRRRTAATLQRALEAHQEEVDESLRRRGRWTGMLLILVILLLPVAFWLGLHRASTQSAGTASELAELREEVARLSAAAEDAALDGRLNELEETVSGVSTTVERLDSAGAAEDFVELREEVARLSAGGGGAPLESRLGELTEIVSGVADAVERLDAGGGKAVEALLERERSERQAVDTGLAARLGRLEDLQEELNGKVAQQIAGLRSALGGGAAAGPDAQTAGLTAPDQAQAWPDEPSAAGAASPTEEVDGPGTNEAAYPPPQEGESSAKAVMTETAAAELAGSADPSARAETSSEPAEEGVVIVGDRPFALQLIGFFSLEDLRRFAERDDLPAQVYYRQETLRGKPWYVLIHSLHAGSKAAAEEGERLPPDLAALDIWIRPLEEGARLEVLETGADGPSPPD